MCTQFPSGGDPVGQSSTYAKAVAINPNFLQLVLDAGFKPNEGFGEKVFQNILEKPNWSPEDKVNVFEVSFLASGMFSKLTSPSIFICCTLN